MLIRNRNSFINPPIADIHWWSECELGFHSFRIHIRRAEQKQLCRFKSVYQKLKKTQKNKSYIQQRDKRWKAATNKNKMRRQLAGHCWDATDPPGGETWLSGIPASPPSYRSLRSLLIISLDTTDDLAVKRDLNARHKPHEHFDQPMWPGNGGPEREKINTEKIWIKIKKKLKKTIHNRI